MAGSSVFGHRDIARSYRELATKPAIKEDLRLDNGELGIAFTGLAVGLFFGTALAFSVGPAASGQTPNRR